MLDIARIVTAIPIGNTSTMQQVYIFIAERGMPKVGEKIRLKYMGKVRSNNRPHLRKKIG